MNKQTNGQMTDFLTIEWMHVWNNENMQYGK